jgi:hypothetical protein
VSELIAEIGPQRLTLIGAMLIVIVAGYKRLWVWGWQYDEMTKDRDFWRTAAIKGTYMTERTVQLAETAADRALKS